MLVDRALTLIYHEADMASLTTMVEGVASHPEDDLVLATAVSARADHLVTGNKQLLRLDSYQGVSIVSPRRFLTLLEQRQEAPFADDNK